MKNWLIVIFSLMFVACSDSSNTESTDTGADKAEVQLEEKVSVENTEATDVATAQAEPENKAVNITTEEITYEVNGEPFTGFLAFDSNNADKRPGVLIVHEWWGHNDYVRSRAIQLAEMGYVALALDMYGAGKVADHPDNAKAFMQAALANPEALKARFVSARELLAKQDVTEAENIAAIGYCFGGAVVLNMARAGADLDGVASFHGSLATTSPAAPGSVSAKVLVLNGGADPLVPMEQVDAFKAEMTAAGADYEFVNYPDVLHSFTNPGATEKGQQFEMPLAYDEQADSDSWQRLENFLAELWPKS
ncbi:MAG: dienelactone hydrolase family protein [Gammaproteobacteria bacterium]|jgi:dienelactone hydrolase